MGVAQSNLRWGKQLWMHLCIHHMYFFVPVRHHRQLFKIVLELQTHSLSFYIVGPTTYPPSLHRGGIRLWG